MSESRQVTVQEQKPVSTQVSAHASRAGRLELLFRKMSLAAITLIGIGYILINASVAILMGESVAGITIASQSDVAAITGRILFLMALTISIFLGVLFIFGAVQFYERGTAKGVILLGVLLGAFYLMCLGVGSTLLLSESNLAALALATGPLFVVASTALYISSNRHCRLFGSMIGIVGGIILAYAISNLRAFDLVFKWAVPFTGPFLSLTLLESTIMILAPIAATVQAVFDHSREEHSIPHLFDLLLVLVYGLGAFIGSILLSMSFWNLVWQSPWNGPFHGLPELVASVTVFWSASLVLMDIGGILLMAVACLGFVCMARGLPKL